MKRIKNKISFRLFVVTVIFFSLFISVQLILQSLFFKNFYVSRKISGLNASVEKFEKTYVESLKTGENVSKKIMEFEEKNDAKIAILESNGLLNYITDFKNEETDSVKINIIKSIIKEWTADPKNLFDIQDRNKTVTYVFNDKVYNIKNVVSVNPIMVNNIPAKVMFVMKPLQPVDEAVAVLKDFYVYIYIIALILIFILSFIYSNMISKPLINLNNTASKMAELDFSEKCDDARGDEIGNLARTLNFLSDNLYKTMNSLKESNKKLKKDIEKEKQLEKMRKEFVAAASHELKTPISIIEGYAEGIQDGIAGEDEIDEYLDVIIDESQKMGRLVSDMLELSSLDSGKFKMNKKEFLLSDLIYEVVKRIKLTRIKDDKGENSKKVNIDVLGKLNVFGDKGTIEEVITNFLTNAVRHTKEGGNIYVRAFEKENHVLVEIENEGDTIPNEHIDRIWERFYKIDKSRKRDYGGTGLGLSIVKEILELHNSEYGVENTDKGVKFYFTIGKMR